MVTCTTIVQHVLSVIYENDSENDEVFFLKLILIITTNKKDNNFNTASPFLFSM